MVTKPQKRAEEFVEAAEKPAQPPKVEDPVESYIEGLPPWKQRNLEYKGTGTQFRFSVSQKKLLRLAALDQETSMQKILERLVWPAIEERYGITTEDAPS